MRTGTNCHLVGLETGGAILTEEGRGEARGGGQRVQRVNTGTADADATLQLRFGGFPFFALRLRRSRSRFDTLFILVHFVLSLLFD